MEPSKPKKLAVSTEFTSEGGRFYGIFAVAELTMDFAIGKFLAIPHEETHLITAGADFNRKARLLQALVKRKSPLRANEIIEALKTIQNESLRNTFAHSYLTGDQETVQLLSGVGTL